MGKAASVHSASHLLLVVAVLLAMLVVPTIISARPAGADGQSTAWGTYVRPATTGADNRDQLAAQEQLAGRAFALDHQYRGLGTSDVITDHEIWTRDNGRVPFVNYGMNAGFCSKGKCANTAAQNFWPRLVGGEYDAILVDQATKLKAFGSQVYFTFMHEPEDDSPWEGTAADYVAAWQHVRQVFTDQGVTNVVYIWVLMATTFRSGTAAQWYPGDDVVDVVGADGYNWSCTKNYGAGRPGCGLANWTTFANIFSSAHGFAGTKAKPFWVAETGVAEDPDQPGRKAQWLLDIANVGWPDLAAFVYFQGGDNVNYYRIDSSPSALYAYQALGNDPRFGGPGGDRPPMTVAISAPAAGSTLAGTVTVAAAAIDDHAVAKVEFFAGNISIGSTTVKPYSIQWDTTTVPNGPVTLQAVPTDSSGQTDQLTQSVTVLNSTAPAPPSAVSAVAGDGSAKVSWTPGASGGSPITGFTVTASPAAGSPVTVDGATTEATVPGLTNGTSYTFTVTATNAVGSSTPSDPSNAVVPIPAATAPGAPISVTAVAGDRSATVSWLPGEDGGSAITKFTVTATPAAGAPVTLSGSSTSSTVTGLSNGVTYTFAVAASNAAGTGPAAVSNPVVPVAIRVEETSPAITYRRWSAVGDSAASDGSYHATDGSTEQASLTYTGRSVTWQAIVSPNRGRVKVLLDGLDKGTVDLYSATAGRRLWTYNAAVWKSHTLTLLALGTANPAASGKSVTIDGFLVDGRVLPDSSRSITYGTWQGLAAAGASGGQARASQTVGATLAYTFTGTAVDLITRVGPTEGRVRLTVDGVTRATLDLSATKNAWQAVRTVAGLPPRQHKLVITVLGKGAHSARTGGWSTVDAFVPR